jgi:MoaA/NifB/PqqE/SkfB family radical SAM enzyme
MGVLAQVNQKAREQRIPLTIHFDLTYRCHQRCLHCYLPEAYRCGEGPGPELDTVQIKGILEQLAAAGTFFITFSGGEIFLRPDLMDLLEYTRTLNFCMTLMTSGTLGFENIKALAGLGLEGIRVSLYSLDAAVHDRITGMPGSWKQTWRFVEEARAQGLRASFNCTAFSLNYRDIPSIADLSAREGIYYIVDDNPIPTWEGRPQLPELVLQPEQRLFLRDVLGFDAPDPKIQAVTVPKEMELGGCGAGITGAYLTPQGEVWPCLDIRWPCGRVRQAGDFLTIWQNSPALESLRDLHDRAAYGDEKPCDYLQREEVATAFYTFAAREGGPYHAGAK